MAWHKKGLNKEDRARADLAVAKALLDIVELDKDKMGAEKALEISFRALELTFDAINFLEEVNHDSR